MSDLLAGVSDFFGGRSSSYRRQLESLYSETVADLLNQAHARGGNWLVGLRIDLAEVSGKGTQMFMISGMATAVCASHAPVRSGDEGEVVARIGPHVVADMESRLRILRMLAGDCRELSEEHWGFLRENRVHEACKPILSSLTRCFALKSHWPAHIQKNVSALFAAIPPALTVPMLYEMLSDEDLGPAAVEIICEGDLADYHTALRLISGSHNETKRRALLTLAAGQPWYSELTLQEIRMICNVLQNAFPNLTRSLERKGRLGGSRALWQCPCGEENLSETVYCTTCTRDCRGLRAEDLSPEDAIALLARRGEAIEAIVEARAAERPAERRL